jgi:hypothetical protein
VLQEPARLIRANTRSVVARRTLFKVRATPA